MIKEFRDTLPKEFVTNTLALCGDVGESWLGELPRLIAELENDWSIKVERHFSNLSFNYVAPATCRNGDQAVLKIGLPLNDIEIYGEAKFLRIAGGGGAIKLLREDRELHAILLERAVPGKNLTSIFAGRESHVLDPAISVLKKLLKPPPDDRSDVILLDHWFDGLRRYGKSEFPAIYAEKALGIYETLSQQTDRIYYLHGDLHHENILSSDRAGYLAIDPKGIVGHIGYEIAVFLNNHHWWQDHRQDVRESLDLAISQFSTAFDIDPVELRQWAFAQMVLSAWWTFDEMPNIYNNEVDLADVWEV